MSIDTENIQDSFEQNKFITGELKGRNLDDIVLFCIKKGKGHIEDLKIHKQLDYLYGYLDELRELREKEKVYFLAEPDYIDRDFINDFARFYSKCMHPYPNKCLRVHFFTNKVDSDFLATVIKDLQLKKPEESEEYLKLESNYLGFVIFRPLAKPFVGRTVLRVYPEETGRNRQRHYTCTRKYEVNLAGIPLEVIGLAFQEQDTTIGACATAAIWCVLHKAAFDAKFRIPTPGEITESATRYYLGQGRQFPSPGLTLDQICEGIRSYGLAPEFLPVESATPEFLKEVLHCYLNSGIPLIGALSLYTPTMSDTHCKLRAKHAITFLGYGEVKEPPPIYRISDITREVIETRFEALRLDTLYAHDDRIGPYLRIKLADQEFLEEHLSPDEYDFRPSGYEKEDLVKSPHLKIYRSKDAHDFQLAWLTHLIAPVYPKLRLPYKIVREESVARLATFDKDILSKEKWSKTELPVRLKNFTLKYSFIRGKDYARSLQKELLGMGFEARAIVNLLEPLRLPRQVGVCEVSRLKVDGNKQPLLDLLFDTTESCLGWPIFAVILKHPILLPFEENLCEFFRVAQVYFPR